MSETMKPCPFCGGDAEMEETTGGGAVEYAPEYRAACRRWRCAEGVWTTVQAEAIAAWNRRAEPAGEWVMAPREPTPEMVAAWCRTKNTGSLVPGETGEDRSDYAAYRALLAARPAGEVEIERVASIIGEYLEPSAYGIPRANVTAAARAILGVTE